MQKQSTYTRLLYAIIIAIVKFKHYLLGHEFIFKTNKKSIKCLLDQTIQTPQQQIWLHKFLGCDFSIAYKLGKRTKVLMLFLDPSAWV